ncbi:MAG: alpha-glucan family phosphorylase [Spirochaetales bacterium]|nr:alpha-glucan family phosphorylase [Spirochaetales bacterium]
MKIETFIIQPQIPQKLENLDKLAHNIWTIWNYDAVNLFIRLDYDSWIASNQNPVKMLGLVSQARLEQMSTDDSFLAAYDIVCAKFQKYIDGDSWYENPTDEVVAYFSMEYGLHISLPIYSGGLGILSGDHMKSASDLGIPLVGVGLLYSRGYFRQYLNIDGFQQEVYPEYDWYTMPVRECLDKNGNPRKISVHIGHSTVVAQIWEIKVGRNSIYLLDSNIPENTPENRAITATLYGGGRETRLRQEVLLGIGGMRALQTLGIKAVVTHMNEGHSAFLGIERIRTLIQDQHLTFNEARQAVWPTNIFTTHTPVPAGNESFSIELIEKYLKPYVKDLGITWEEFLSLGRDDPKNQHSPFCLTSLALKLSAYCNGVSKLHGNISRKMWKNIWIDLPEEEIPIRHITNGVHPKTWLSPVMNDLFDKYFGPRFYEEPANFDIWDRIDRVSDEELWRSHERRREELVVYTRERLRQQLHRKGRTKATVSLADEALSPYHLTISFARRFATYKRANLLLMDPDRFIKLLSNNDYPIQFIFAGKAHPEDIPGKELIKQLVHFSSDPRVRSRMIFLEDYDFTLGRHLISGSDMWMNTPRRPLEASGTSGMKAAINGVLNVSVLDGWWDEAYEPEIGWAIGEGEEYEDHNLHDEIESKALFDLLEREIIPLFYARGRDNLPREWIKKMKGCIKNIGKQFTSSRMVKDYSEMFYIPAFKNHKRFTENSFKNTREITRYLDKLKNNWENIKIVKVKSENNKNLVVGKSFTIHADVNLATFSPEEISVELYYGQISSTGEIINAKSKEMECINSGDQLTSYSTELSCIETGRYGYSVRILPKHELLVHPYIPGFIKWD